MPNIQIVSREKHGKKRWRRLTDYKFTARDSVCPLTTLEMPKAMMCLPIGFIANGSGYTPVALLGLEPHKNLFVSIDGRWLAAYIPAPYRGYPFMLTDLKEGQHALCIDEESGAMSDGPDGEIFFDEESKPGEVIGEILRFLIKVSANRKATQRVCDFLQENNLIQPWPIVLQRDNGEQKVEGLFRVDEAALNTMPGEKLIELRALGGLTLVFCQLLSMQNLERLIELGNLHRKAAEQMVPSELNLDFLNDSGNISFG